MNARIEVIDEPRPIELMRAREFADYYLLSPYVVRVDTRYEMLVRLVNRAADAAKKVSRVYFADSTDGTHFTMGSRAIAPGSAGAPDDGGCEDPTVIALDGSFVVFYSGYERARQRSLMLRAVGTDLSDLQKTGDVLPPHAFKNPKEAAVVAIAGGYRLFLESVVDDASRIGVAEGRTLDGPWIPASAPIDVRAQCFDSWHLSPCSAIRRSDGTHVLFYNGATEKTDWRVGWVVLDASATTVIERCEAPLLVPFDLEKGDTDIAFAASTTVIGPHTVAIYYSVSDRRLYRTLLHVANAEADSAVR